MTRRVLVIEDDEPTCRLMRAIFQGEAFEVATASTVSAALKAVAHEPPDLVLLDLRLQGTDGFPVLEKLSVSHPTLPVVVLTADVEAKTAVRAIKAGAFDYLTKPIDHDQILIVARRALDTRALKVEVEDLRRQVGEGADLAHLMGPSRVIRQVIEQVNTVAASNFSVLVIGETGTGKELVAQAIHRHSQRRRMPFVALDCGAIPEGLIESELFGHERGAFTGADRRRIGRFQLAAGGTLFLDEVGNLPLSLQSRLLRVLESRQVQALGGGKALDLDVRFVAATNDNLQERAGGGLFRPDLYFRLAQYTIALPPLRERPSDIAPLVRRFIEEVTVELRHPVQEITPDALRLLEQHAWPGNVRELRNVVRRAVLESKDLSISRPLLQKVLGMVSDTHRAPPAAAGTRSLRQIADDAAADAERAAICATLRATKGNKSQAARTLQTDFKTLHLKMKALGIRAQDFSG